MILEGVGWGGGGGKIPGAPLHSLQLYEILLAIICVIWCNNYYGSILTFFRFTIMTQPISK